MAPSTTTIVQEDMMIIATLLIVFLASLLATYFSIPLAIRFRLVDSPGELKIHTYGIPRFGGLGILCGVIVGSVMFRVPQLGFLAGSALAWLVGAVDDRWSIAPWTKLWGQALAGIMLAFILARGHSWQVGLFYGAMGFILVIGLMNAMNLIDGMDGLASGNSVLIFLAIGVLEFLHHLDFRLTLVFAVSSLGFLPLNFPAARTFMGDSGSLLLGFLLAFSLMTLLEKSPTLFLAGILISILPIFDVVLGIARRIAHGMPLFHGDREHFYDRLNQRVKNKTTTVLLTFLITALCASGGIAASFLPPIMSTLGLGALALLLLLIILQLSGARFKHSGGLR